MIFTFDGDAVGAKRLCAPQRRSTICLPDICGDRTAWSSDPRELRLQSGPEAVRELIVCGCRCLSLLSGRRCEDYDLNTAEGELPGQAAHQCFATIRDRTLRPEYT